jgi:general secretion pathway protein I
MVSTLKNINWLFFGRNSIANTGISETRIQNPESSIQYPAPSIQDPASSIQDPARGFTLLEVMVAVAIMSIVLVSVYRLHSQSLAMNTETRFYTQAPMLAQSKLAEMGTGEDAEFINDSGDFGEEFGGFSWNVAVDEVDIEALGEISQDLKKIEVTVSYNDNEFVYNLRTFRLIREE